MDNHERYADSGSQFDRSNWTTTGMDSDYGDDTYLVDGEVDAPPVDVSLNYPRIAIGSPHAKSTSLFEDMWIYLKKKLFGGDDAS